MFWIIVSIIFVFLIGFYLLKSSDDKQLPSNVTYPPIEKGAPLIGVVLDIKKSLYEYFWNLSKKHGPIYRVCFGANKFLILNNYEWLKICFKDDADTFSGRYTDKIVKKISRCCGILFTDGFRWKTSRSFSLKVLRDFGLGKSKSLEIVDGECQILLKELEENQNRPINFAEYIPIYTLNVISKFLMNKRFNRNNPDVKFIQYVIEDVIVLRNPFQMLFLMYPYLQRFNWITNLLVYSFKHTKNFNKIHQIFIDEIELHRETLSEKSEGEDLMDRFLMEQKSMENKSPELKEVFEDFQLVRMSLELYIAGYETTSTTLVWVMMFLSKFPLVQEEIFKEINNNIGTNKRADMSDKKSLHYTQAVMDEILRMGAIAPVALFHRTINDTIVGNKYFIPKDTLVMPNIYACCRDPEIWEKPFEFYPEHFLKWSEETKSFQYNPREELVVFGIGKRQCLGESLARMEYFIFLVSILQKYKVEFANDVTSQDYENALKPTDTIIRMCTLKDYIFKKR